MTRNSRNSGGGGGGDLVVNDARRGLDDGPRSDVTTTRQRGRTRSPARRCVDIIERRVTRVAEN